jgi:3-dehydroquinate dehydratase/shikimate dehydrogenase
LSYYWKAAEAGCQIIDLEVESAEEAKPAQLAPVRDGLRGLGAALLVSFHDFTRTKGLGAGGGADRGV